MGNVMENGNKKEKVITRMAAYDWLKVMGTLMVVIGCNGIGQSSSLEVMQWLQKREM